MKSEDARLADLRALALERNAKHAPRLIEGLSHHDPQWRILAVRGLSWIRSKSFAPQISTRLLDPSDEVRRWAAAALAITDCHSPTRLQLLNHVRRETHPSVIAACIRTLGWLNERRSHSLLRDILVDVDADALVVSSALEAVGRMALADLVPYAIPHLRSTSSSVRRHAVRVFQKCNEAPLPQQVLKLLQDPDPETRALMVRMIVARKLKSASELIHPLLTDDNPGVRATTVIGFISLGEVACHRYLAKMTNETHPEVLKHLSRAQTLFPNTP